MKIVVIILRETPANLKSLKFPLADYQWSEKVADFFDVSDMWVGQPPSHWPKLHICPGFGSLRMEKRVRCCIPVWHLVALDVGRAA